MRNDVIFEEMFHMSLIHKIRKFFGISYRISVYTKADILTFSCHSKSALVRMAKRMDDVLCIQLYKNYFGIYERKVKL